MAAAAAPGAEPATPQGLLQAKGPDVSLRNEVRHAIDKGWTWMVKSQDTNGFWSSADYPAMTGLALVSYQLQPGVRDQRKDSDTVKKAYAYLASCIQPDGGIYRKELPSYNTSIALMALVLSDRPEFQSAILKARRFVIGLQVDQGEVGKIDTANDGGVGYGKADKQPDLSNTSWALEALALCKSYLKEKNLTDSSDLNWPAAIHFIQSCQNLPGYNPEKWASGDPQNKGGFIYAPGASKAGETNLNSRVALRSYGSMSYAGLLSYAYADLKPDDPRVTAVMDWLKSNYTLDENPGMEKQGLFYYFHTMAKALTVCGTDTLDTQDGRKVNWREQLALKLMNLQKADGSWANDNGRWFEKDPTLVTAYSLIALDMIYSRL